MAVLFLMYSDSSFISKKCGPRTQLILLCSVLHCMIDGDKACPCKCFCDVMVLKMQHISLILVKYVQKIYYRVIINLNTYRFLHMSFLFS